ncbi:hypothetical protein SNE40_018881 [Patella caerulea]|uniref:Uncharacterized protein n=1 Tax=Patella caerulea TaxID=87958 RepID=A0AAN8PDI7_PATCE
MDHPRRGKAVIINNEEFPYSNLRPIKGSQNSVDCLTRGLQKLRFQVETHDDLSKAEIMDRLQKVASEDHSEADCLVVTVMSHGSEYGICGTDYGNNDDYSHVHIHDIVDLFKANSCRSLAGKPKIFIINACRGNMMDSGVAVKDNLSCFFSEKDGESPRIPTPSDILIFYSCFKGHVSIASDEEGSAFINCLGKVLYEYGEFLPLSDLLLLVKERVAADISTVNIRGESYLLVDMPTVSTDTLRKKICFMKRKLVL